MLSQLFYNTQISACLWFLTHNKGETSKFRNRNYQTLFIDARKIGLMISRKQKELTDNDIEYISEIYHTWRGKEFHKYSDIAGVCKSASIDDIRQNNYILTPGRYIDFKEAEDDGIPFDEKMQELTAKLAANQRNSQKKVFRKQKSKKMFNFAPCKYD
ncbi:MAG: SAM-dependent methyltransferase [Prevotellaceae bacterium]|nr:SAM-dependent methyltransferase [Prevotellaceae bacterium]